MVCRNNDKAEEARAEIVKESGNTVSVCTVNVGKVVIYVQK